MARFSVDTRVRVKLVSPHYPRGQLVGAEWVGVVLGHVEDDVCGDMHLVIWEGGLAHTKEPAWALEVVDDGEGEP
jgi:hypothetical protein